MVVVFDYLYTYYRKNRRAGLYPLPYSKLRKFHNRYNEIVPWLCSIGFLEDSDNGYSTNLHVCRYYRINRKRFLPSSS